MKLVEILARELNEWPVWNPEFAYCDYCGEIRFRYWSTCDFYPMEAVDLSDRGGIGYESGQTTVTRAQWEAERARIAQEEDDRMLAKHKAGADELERRHAEAVREAEDWSNECQKQYEQELWDKVAERVFCMAFVDGLVGWNAVGFEQESKRAMNAADAFMAERAKRLKR